MCSERMDISSVRDGARRLTDVVRSSGGGAASLLGLLAALTPIAAHAAAKASTPQWWTWDLSPYIVVPTALVLAIYWRGLERRPGAFDAQPARHIVFLAGVTVVFLSLASPLDGLSDHLFSAHQVQHMALRVVGPMLVAFAQPQATLVAGLPRWSRRGVMTRLAKSPAIKRTFVSLAHPATATLVFVASLYVWQWPPLHNRAILDEGVHDVMHVTMLLAGLFYFWRVFDQRPPPKGVRFGARLMMLWVGVLANIPIGAFTCFKSHELYPAYDVVGRLFGVSPMDDERLGGFIMWAPSSMMMLFAILAVVHAWGGHEERLESRRLASAASGAGGGAVAQAVSLTPKNRAFALGLGAFSICVLAATLTIALLAARHSPAAEATAPAVAQAASFAAATR
jgi:putative membrane protein